MTSFNPLTQENNTPLRGLLSKLPKLTVAGFPKDLETFTLFPNLPLELRLKIWSYAGDHPQTLQLTDTWSCKSQRRVGVEGNNQVPGILQACAESREEGLKHYTACTKRCAFSVEIHGMNGHVASRKPCTASKVYINFDVDRFYMQRMEEQDLPNDMMDEYLPVYQLESSDLAKIQLLDIPWEYLRVPFLRDSVLIKEAKSLREVNFIITPYFCKLVRLENSDSVEVVCPNTIASEICMEAHRNYVKKTVDEEMITDRLWPDPTTWESLKDTKFGCKWRAIPEEMDLFPISAGAAATYDNSSGCHPENKETVYWKREDAFLARNEFYWLT
jgi:hypothetical protein